MPEPGHEVLACGHYGRAFREGSPASTKRRCEPCGDGHVVAFETLAAQLLDERSVVPAIGAAVMVLEAQLGYAPRGASAAVRAAVAMALDVAEGEVRRGWSR